MKTAKTFIGLMLGFCLGSPMAIGQTGDQILDGIGETGLVARFVLKEDVRDWSRNNWHGTLQGAAGKFVPDDLFGTVLSLPGDGESFVSIPGAAVAGEESLSITGWIYLNAATAGPLFFDFAQGDQSRLFVAPTGTADREGCQVQLRIPSGKYINTSAAMTPYKWNHLAVVIDVPSKTVTTYLNGRLAAETKNVEVSSGHLFGPQSGATNKLYIGRSVAEDPASFVNAKLHDLRIYRIPLSDRQVARIHGSALRRDDGGVRIREEADKDLPKFPEETPQLYTAYLTAVPDIHTETVVGRLPRLPRHVPGVYSGGLEGPKVRVLWPAPKDNQEVLTPGTYTVTGRVAGTTLQPRAVVAVKAGKKAAAPGRALEMFKLEDVTLNTDLHDHNTKFIENRDKFLTGLAQTNPDNFLYMFRNAFGQDQPDGAKPLGGWDSQETKVRGQTTGHYLTALAQTYAGTGHDPALQATFAARMEYMVGVLYDLSRRSGQPARPGGESVSDPTLVPPGPGKPGFNSDLSEQGIRTDYWNWGTGFISAYPPDQFIMLEQGATYGGDNAKIWAPYYTLHKILAGLMDVYEVRGNAKALEIVKGMGDWVFVRLRQLPTETLISMWNRYIAGEFGGMNEAMARLYRLTNEPRYLEVARLFDNIRVFYGDADHAHGLAKNVDMFRGLHANQHIPQIIGALELYRDSDNPDYWAIADNFWHIATNDYMYSIGGVAGARNPANAECFTSEPATLYENGFSSGGQNETCATYNLLKLTGSLFLYDQRAELMDYYERGLYNHILASVDASTPANTYHVPLRPGSVKHFGNAQMDGFSCCNGTALESNTKLQSAIWFKSADNKSLYLNLFIPSTLTWTDRQLTVTQATSFPNEDQTRLTIGGSGKFDLHIRVPHWATKGFFVTINGKKENVKAEPGTYIRISRTWKDGDVVELRMPFTFYLEPVMDQQNIASLFYGPVLLAAQEPEPRKDWRQVTLDAKDIGKTISGDPKKLEFNIDGVLFKPFYETYGRHSVYLDVRLR
ncbi:MAG: glycoside hydrolase family 127 protein [Bacteroidales bacterium]